MHNIKYGVQGFKKLLFSDTGDQTQDFADGRQAIPLSCIPSSSELTEVYTHLITIPCKTEYPSERFLVRALFQTILI